MQIISGKFKHSPIKSPNSSLTHPMGSREKLALFNALTGEIEGKTVLDAFAGTGALGLEALSRGAKSVVFLEKSPKIAQTLKENVEKTLKNEKDLSEIVISDLKNYQTDKKFDLVFADPPYELYSEAILAPLLPLLSKTAILTISIPKTAKTPLYDGLELISRREYAGSAIIIYRK